MLTYSGSFFDLPGRGMTKPRAEGILALDFPEADAKRAEKLNVKTNDGMLTDDEQAELEAYQHWGPACVLVIEGSPGYEPA